MGRAEFKSTLIDGVKEILKDDKRLLEHNVALISKLIDSKSDKELEALVDDLESGKSVIPLIIPNGSTLNYENLLKTADKLGIVLHKRVITVKDGVKTMSPIPRLILEIPGKKLSQLVDKKRSIADDQNSVNHLTGQVTGPSKSMSITSAETPLMLANGQYDSIRELTKYRGGDLNAKIVIEKLAEQGIEITQATLEKYSSGPEVNNTVKQLLLGMHLDAGIGEIK